MLPRVGILLLGIALSILAWLEVASFDQQIIAREHERRFLQLSSEVSNRVTQALTVVRGLKGLFIASEDVTRQDFHAYASALQVGQGTAGIQALQFARLVTHAERPVFESRVARDTSLAPRGYPGFRITPEGERPFYVATEYNEPMAGNEATMGFDSAFGPTRTAVYERARDSGQLLASAPFRLVQMPDQAGVVIRAPLYQADRPVETVEQRRAAYYGQVSALIVVDRLVGAALRRHIGADTEVAVSDISPEPASGKPLAGADALLGRYGDLPKASFWRTELTASGQVEVAGRLWQLEMRTRPLNPYLQAKALLAGALALALTLLMLAELNRAMGQQAEQQQRAFAAQLEATVEARTAELTRVNAEMEAFAYSVAHDLRAPARHIHGFARVLELRHSAALDDKGRDYLGRITRASEDMGHLIEELLAFSHLGHQPLSMTLVDLNEVVARYRESLVTGTEDRAVQWHISALPTVRGDTALLGRALSNLMGNALKYSARSNPAIIEVFADASTAGEHRICVRDNGVGVDMRYAHRLFQVFSRLHHSDEFEGTGIGLANVRRIIDRHRGRVWAQGEPGKGSEFWIALPA